MRITNNASKPIIATSYMLSQATARKFHSSKKAYATVKVTYIDQMGDTTTVDAEVGKNLLDIAHDHNIELEGACGGGTCSYCLSFVGNFRVAFSSIFPSF